MKKIMCLFAVITTFMLLLPMAVLGNQPDKQMVVAANIKTVKGSRADSSPNSQNIFRVYDKSTDTVIELKSEDYIFGVVAAEMPASYETEALKAQAVAAYTYACYKRNGNKAKEYDISTDYTVDQSYISPETARQRWGEKADEYTEKIKDAVKSTLNMTICSNNEPILAVYHAVSSGKTYSAKEVWGSGVPYLQSVLSEGDKLASNYLSTVSFTEKELETKLIGSLKVKKSDKDIINNRCTSKSGIVTSVTVFGNEISGGDLRSALDLPSTNYKYEKEGDKYTFTAYGYGHGVGMSQNGANYMAKQGYTYDKILSHYYTGCKLKKT